MSMRSWIFAVCGGLSVLSLGGCPQGDTCDSANPVVLLQAATKFANCGMQDLTSCEIRVLVATVSELSPDVNIVINEEEAQAVVDFIKANDLNCLADVEDIVNRAQSDPDSIEVPESLKQLIESGVDVGSIVQAG